MSEDEIRAMVQDKIARDVGRQGWSAIGVFPTADEPDYPHFLYTVGARALIGVELIVFGMPHALAHQVVALVIEQVQEDGLTENENMGRVLSGYPVRLRTVPASRAPVGAASVFHGTEEFDVAQVVWPDKWGLFPWEDGAEPLTSQPVLAEGAVVT